MAVRSRDAKVTPAAQLRSFIEQYDPKLQKLFGAVRTAVRKRLPAANELVYEYRDSVVIAFSPTEHPTQGILSISARDDGVRLYFMNGPRLPDPKKLLTGTGKQVRFIEVETARQLARPEVEALIAAAVDLASVPLPARGRGEIFIRSVHSEKRPRKKAAK